MATVAIDHAQQRALGPLTLQRWPMVAGALRLPADPAPSRDKSMLLLVQRAGAASFEQLGNRARLGPGDATLCDPAVPYDLRAQERGEGLILRVPARALREHLPSPAWYCGRRLPGDRGMTAPFVALAAAILDGVDAALCEAHHARLARHLLDLVATSYAIAFDGQEANSSIIVGRLATVKLHIEQHLRDPDLTPCSIATSLKLSPRYLRLIFAATDETVSAYVLRRRLEECARQIADPRWRGHSMTEIAFAWGFNSAPHFTRSFRDRFATAPRDYRRAHLDAAGGTPARCIAA